MLRDTLGNKVIGVVGSNPGFMQNPAEVRDTYQFLFMTRTHMDAISGIAHSTETRIQNAFTF